MKKKTLIKAAALLTKTLCMLICVAVAALAFWRWAGENGGEALLFAAGMKLESPSDPVGAPTPQPTSAENETDSDRIHRLLFADDGIAPYHEDALPETATTPDPARSWGEVVETLIDGGQQVENFHVRDTTGSGTDLAWELTQSPAAGIKADGTVEVLIYHTHTSEAYSKTYTGFYYTDMEVRTQNQDMSVVAAGEELKRTLESYGIGVVHDTTVCDTVFNGSYSRSWDVIQDNLEKYPTIQITIDLHRDSMTTEGGAKYKPTAVINGRKAAQFMLLAGCNYDDSWDDFPDWEQNLRLMLRIQQKAETLYPGLARPLDFSDSRYNMNATPGSMLVEVGTEVNTVGEARYCARLFGDALAQALLNGD